MAERQKPGIGDQAPDFTLPSATGEPVTLSDFRGKAEVVLFFYPKANSPVCTAEACSFRDRYEAFREAGAEVIGISEDRAGTQKRFAGRFGLPYLLLSDAGGAVRALYGVPKTLGVFPGRTTYLIDRQGVIRHVLSSQFQFARHVTETLDVLRSFQGPASTEGVR